MKLDSLTSNLKVYNSQGQRARSLVVEFNDPLQKLYNAQGQSVQSIIIDLQKKAVNVTYDNQS